MSVAGSRGYPAYHRVTIRDEDGWVRLPSWVDVRRRRPGEIVRLLP